MKIGEREVGSGHPCFIIAEMGVNHNADLDIALRMVRAAKDAGADALKVQMFSAESFCSPKAVYKGELQVDLFKVRELSIRMLARIAQECKDVGIIFFGTPDSVEYGRLLVNLGAPVLKIGSDDLVYDELIDGLSGLGVPLILSTGMAGTGEIVAATRLAGECALLHCVSLYPTPQHKANLDRMRSLRGLVKVIGYSDHTDGILACLSAVAMGASILEKHFTLDRSLPGPDHAFSADPQQLADLVQGVRTVEAMMGTGDIRPGPEEMEMRKLARRSIIADCDIAEGQTIERKHLALKRPGTGLAPYSLDVVVGRVAKRALPINAIISLQDLA